VCFSFQTFSSPKTPLLWPHVESEQVRAIPPQYVHAFFYYLLFFAFFFLVLCLCSFGRRNSLSKESDPDSTQTHSNVYNDLTCATTHAHLSFDSGLSTRTKILESLANSLTLLILSWLLRLLHFLTPRYATIDSFHNFPFCL